MSRLPRAPKTARVSARSYPYQYEVRFDRAADAAAFVDDAHRVGMGTAGMRARGRVVTFRTPERLVIERPGASPDPIVRLTHKYDVVVKPLYASRSAAKIAASIAQNVDDYDADRIDYDEFTRRQARDWDEASRASPETWEEVRTLVRGRLPLAPRTSTRGYAALEPIGLVGAVVLGAMAAPAIDWRWDPSRTRRVRPSVAATGAALAATLVAAATRRRRVARAAGAVTLGLAIGAYASRRERA